VTNYGKSPSGPWIEARIDFNTVITDSVPQGTSIPVTYLNVIPRHYFDDNWLVKLIVPPTLIAAGEVFISSGRLVDDPGALNVHIQAQWCNYNNTGAIASPTGAFQAFLMPPSP